MIKQQLKARFTQVPADQSLVDELIAERRVAAHQESVEGSAIPDSIIPDSTLQRLAELLSYSQINDFVGELSDYGVDRPANELRASLQVPSGLRFISPEGTCPP